MTETRNDSAPVWGDDFHLSLNELCRACQITAEQAFALLEEGVIEPQGAEPTGWRFQLICVRRVRRAYRLTRDLGINLAGAALAVDLLEEIEQLRAHLRRLERGDF